MRRITPIALVLLSMSLLGCAASSPKAARSSAATDAQDAQAGRAGDPYMNEIVVMWHEIRQWRTELGLHLEPADDKVLPFRRLPLARALDVCPEAPEPTSSTCEDVCTLADHICENAEDICRIAGQMPGNSWAADKCSSSKASCKEAKEKCCHCDESDAPADSEAPADTK